jgi:hypothetical protein
VNPAEVEQLTLILELWSSQGHGPRGIPRELNDQNTPSRTGSQWDHSVVASIIARNQNFKEHLIDFLKPNQSGK